MRKAWLWLERQREILRLGQLPEIGDTIDNERALELIRRQYPQLSGVAARIAAQPQAFRPWIFDG